MPSSNPTSDEAHHQLGFVYLHIGLLDEAMREVREAVRLLNLSRTTLIDKLQTLGVSGSSAA